jgi:hypothetical protein
LQHIAAFTLGALVTHGQVDVAIETRLTQLRNALVVLDGDVRLAMQATDSAAHQTRACERKLWTVEQRAHE